MTVINLNRFRKQKQREEARRRADANAVKHGQTKADRTKVGKQRDQLDAKLDGARLSEEQAADDDSRADDGDGDRDSD